MAMVNRNDNNRLSNSILSHVADRVRAGVQNHVAAQAASASGSRAISHLANVLNPNIGHAERLDHVWNAIADAHEHFTRENEVEDINNETHNILNELDQDIANAQEINRDLQLISHEGIDSHQHIVAPGEHREGGESALEPVDVPNQGLEQPPAKRPRMDPQPTTTTGPPTAGPSTRNDNNAMPGGSNGGAVIASGGLRTSNVTAITHSHAYTGVHEIVYYHDYLIRAYTENRQPERYNEQCTPDSRHCNHSVRLKSDWHEVPDNALSFYIQKSDLDMLVMHTKYWRILGAGWEIVKGDLFTVATNGTTTKSITSQWQPSLKVCRSWECIPPGRLRNWGQDGGQTDNSFVQVFNVCGLAKNGYPQFLPNITWVLRDQTAVSSTQPIINPFTLPLDTNTPDVDARVGHLDILQNCHTEYEQTHTSPIGNMKNPAKVWRALTGGPYLAYKINSGDNPPLAEGRPLAGSMIHNYNSNDPHRNHVSDDLDIQVIYPGTTVDNRQQILASQLRHLIGFDPNSVKSMMRNDMDEYFPHIEKHKDNPPCFIALSKPPDLGQNTEWVYKIKIKSVIAIQFDTPVKLPYEEPIPEVIRGPSGDNYKMLDGHGPYHGDNRMVHYKNDIRNIALEASSGNFVYEREKDECFRFPSHIDDDTGVYR